MITYQNMTNKFIMTSCTGVALVKIHSVGLLCHYQGKVSQRGNQLSLGLFLFVSSLFVFNERKK